MTQQIDQFREHVVRPTLHEIGLWSEAAENLLVGTAIAESNLELVKQVGGPALSHFKIEPATHDWLIEDWLKQKGREDLHAAVLALRAPVPDHVSQLMTNMAYACAVCRLRYWVVPERLPVADDLASLAGYWKTYYNTVHGKGSPAEFERRYRRHHPTGKA